MKKIWTSLLILCLISLFLVACNKADTANSTTDQENSNVEQADDQTSDSTSTEDTTTDPAVTTDSSAETKTELPPPKTIEEEINRYVNVTLPEIWILEENALLEFYSVTGENYVDDISVYQKLVNVVLPTYNEFVKEITDLQTYSEEMKVANQLYITAATKQLEALKMMRDKLEAGESDYMKAADTKLSEASEGFDQWQTEVMALADKYHVTINEPDVPEEESTVGTEDNMELPIPDNGEIIFEP